CFRVRVVDRRGRELFAKGAEGDGQIVRDRRGSAQALDGITSLPDRVRALLEGGLQPLFGFQRSIGKDVRCGLKAKHDAMKALQQRVVQLSGDASPFVDKLGFRSPWSRNRSVRSVPACSIAVRMTVSSSYRHEAASSERGRDLARGLNEPAALQKERG